MLFNNKIVLELGHLIVTEGIDPFSFMPKKSYFWSDKRSPQQSGPFNTISEAVENYKSVVQTFNKNTISYSPSENQPLPIEYHKDAYKNVIFVDFVAKKRKSV